MREIGGFLELERLAGREYYKRLLSFNTARNALLYLIKEKNISRLYLPYYICDSIINLCRGNSFNIEFYEIDRSFMPILGKQLGCSEYIYVINYYGQISNGTVKGFKKRYGNVILDNVQAFFQAPIKGIDTIYSCRKYFGVSDGAYLATDLLIKGEIQQDRSSPRWKHLLGRYEASAQEYYNDFRNNEELLDEEPLKRMSGLTHNILGAIDYKEIIKKRNDNFLYLVNCLSSINKLKITVPNGPFAYPLYLEGGMEIKKRLADKGIYIPTLWPNVIRECKEDTVMYQYATNILPLPCDQRYDNDDMKYMVEEMRKLVK